MTKTHLHIVERERKGIKERLFKDGRKIVAALEYPCQWNYYQWRASNPQIGLGRTCKTEEAAMKVIDEIIKINMRWENLKTQIL